MILIIIRFIYVAGGFDGSEILDTIERYDIANNTWEVLEMKLEMPLQSFSIYNLIPGRIVAVGGESSVQFFQHITQYDVETKRIDYLSELESKSPTSSIMFKNKILVFGVSLLLIFCTF